MSGTAIMSAGRPNCSKPMKSTPEIDAPATYARPIQPISFSHLRGVKGRPRFSAISVEVSSVLATQ